LHNQDDSEKRTPFLIAAEKGFYDIVKILLESGADPEIGTLVTPQDPLLTMKSDSLTILSFSRKSEITHYMSQVVKDTIDWLSYCCPRDLKVEVLMSTRKVLVDLFFPVISFLLFLYLIEMNKLMK
jgi:hypothetical protein